MLTADLVKPLLWREGRDLHVHMLDEHDPYWLQTAEELLILLRGLVGSPRQAWEEMREAYEGTRTDYVIVRGLAKVLTDNATFTSLSFPLSPSEVRERIFALGPVLASPDIFHPGNRDEVLGRVAAEVGMTVEQVEAALFADRPSAFVLTHPGPAWTPEQLLARYNLELARGVLYAASLLQVEIHGSYKTLWKYLKFFKLMFWASPIDEGGYHLDLAGPISPFINTTTRYGRAFAAFMPAILLCERWSMAARVRSELAEGWLEYRLDHTCSLRTHFKGSGLYDSALEAEFAEEFVAFQEKFGEQRGHWRLLREPEVLLLGDTVMIPDFLAQDVDDEHRQVLVELVGFWEPGYLKRKIAKARAANCRHLLLVVFEGLNVTTEDFRGVEGDVLFFKNKPVLKDIMNAIETLADRVYGPRPKRLKRLEKQRPVPPLLSMLVQQLHEGAAASDDEWWSLAQLEMLLKAIYAQFKPRAYEHSSLSALVLAHPDLFETQRQSGRGRALQVRVRAYRALKVAEEQADYSE